MVFLSSYIGVLSACVPASWEKNGGVILESILLIYGCCILANLCDEYLLPSLERICKSLNLSEDVAGASLLALGGSAPELFIHIFATAQHSEIGLGTIIGSAINNITWAVSIVCLASVAYQNRVAKQKVPEDPKPIALAPFIRDLCFYLGSVLLLYLFRVTNGQVEWWESIILVSSYGIYMTFLITTRSYFAGGNIPPTKASIADDEEDPLLVGAKSPLDQPSRSFYRWLTLPFDMLFYYTVPERPIFSFIVSLIYVAGLSEVVLTLVEHFGCALGINETFLGMTVLAIGASLPDCISMGIAAWHGHGAMAIAGLIGSNVFDILIGLGLPWFIFDILFAPIPLRSPEVLAGIICLLLALVALTISFALHKMYLTKTAAILPFLAYVAYIIYEIITVSSS